MTEKSKNWTIGIVSFIAGVIVTIIGFVVLTLYISFSGDSDETAEAQETEAAEVVEEEIIEPFNLPLLAGHRHAYLSPESIPVGSWWTDGTNYYKVMENKPDTLYMVGTNLEDYGMEITFVKHQDSTMVTEGASGFAFNESPVIYNHITLADGSDVQMLVAYYDSACFYPQAVLQRYHGRGLENQKVEN